MNADKLYNASLRCPYCGHHVHISIDASGGDQDYQDECRACGADIHLLVRLDEVNEKIFVRVASDDENYY